MGQFQAFLEWQPWKCGPQMCARTLQETLDGGQAFRWIRKSDCLEGVWSCYHVKIKSVDGQLHYAFPASTEPKIQENTLEALKDYFALETDFQSITDMLPWRSDPPLKAAIEGFPGLRILRQPFHETLFGFLCSSTKQITQIKAIHEEVARSMGSPLASGPFALPTWSQIAAAGEEPLRAAKLGYRARFIHQTACYLEERPNWLQETATLETEAARQRLLQLPGVGRKIADCVLLFGLGRLDAFPIDTWIEKILTHAYGLKGWSSSQFLQFAKIHFGSSAGYAQQYLFAAARAGLISSRQA